MLLPLNPEILPMLWNRRMIWILMEFERRRRTPDAMTQLIDGWNRKRLNRLTYHYIAFVFGRRGNSRDVNVKTARLIKTVFSSFILTVPPLMSFVNQTCNMADLDLIARLYLSESVDKWISEKIKTSSAYSLVSARPQRSNQRDYTRRQSKKPPEDSVPFHHHKPYIEIRFSNIPRSRHDVVFDSNPRSDIAVFSQGISYHHFTLTFDDVGRFIVKDWGSW